MTYLIFITAALIAFFSLPPHWSILLGVLFSLLLPESEWVKNKGKSLSSKLLQLSIILLGAGLNFQSVIREGTQGVVITFISIGSVFILGALLGRFFKVASPLSTLITAGTSICGGSAISAISPILKADSLTMATSLGIVFILNATAVFLFPPLAHYFDLNQIQFGTWAALAIHDTSSVVAASQIYGEEALQIGTTLKLTRALWIIPLSLIFASMKKSENKMTIPWFIFFFLGNSLLFTFFAELNPLVPYLSKVSKIGLSLTLFLIGLGLNKKQLRQIGFRPVLMGITLWLCTTAGSLIFVKYFLIK